MKRCGAPPSADLGCSSEYSIGAYIERNRLKTGVEQGSVPTAVERGSVDCKSIGNDHRVSKATRWLGMVVRYLCASTRALANS